MGKRTSLQSNILQSVRRAKCCRRVSGVTKVSLNACRKPWFAKVLHCLALGTVFVYFGLHYVFIVCFAWQLSQASFHSVINGIILAWSGGLNLPLPCTDWMEDPVVNCTHLSNFLVIKCIDNYMRFICSGNAYIVMSGSLTAPPKPRIASAAAHETKILSLHTSAAAHENKMCYVLSIQSLRK